MFNFLTPFLIIQLPLLHKCLFWHIPKSSPYPAPILLCWEKSQHSRRFLLCFVLFLFTSRFHVQCVNVKKERKGMWGHRKNKTLPFLLPSICCCAHQPAAPSLLASSHSILTSHHPTIHSSVSPLNRPLSLFGLVSASPSSLYCFFLYVYVFLPFTYISQKGWEGGNTKKGQRMGRPWTTRGGEGGGHFV